MDDETRLKISDKLIGHAVWQAAGACAFTVLQSLTGVGIASIIAHCIGTVVCVIASAVVFPDPKDE